MSQDTAKTEKVTHIEIEAVKSFLLDLQDRICASLEE